MKKTTTLSIAALAVLTANAQLPVSHTAGKKQVLIEEFTGNTCGYCPDGHKISDQITAANPGKAFAVNVHTGGYASPASASNSLDFRVPEAGIVISLPNMVGNQSPPCFGFPAGGVNRVAPVSPAMPMCPGGMGMSRSYWASMASTILAQNTYVNIAGQAYLHPTTRQMIINMEAYYTANSPVSANRITIDLVQDDIIAYQSGASLYPAMVVGSGYRHNHALRDVLNSGPNSGVSGEAMTGPNTAGTTWSKTFTYTVAATYPASGTKTIPAVLADLELIAFITETENSVVAVCKVPITITTSTDIFSPTAETDAIKFVNAYPSPMMNEGTLVFTLNQSADVTIEMVNALGQIVKSEDLKMLDSGEHKYAIDATNLTNGVYLVNLKVDNSVITKKITVLK